VAKVEASTARPVAAMVNHTTLPATEPAMNAGAPRFHAPARARRRP